MSFKIVKPLIISVTLAVIAVSVNACSELKSIIDEPQEIGSVEASTSQTDTAGESSDAENLILFDDWKTNWLENYEPSQLRRAMETHDYGLQARLYSEAIRRHFKAELGGAFYVFIRGGTYLKEPLP